MVMTLNLDYWETMSLTAGCNLYSSKFRLCVLTVRSAEEQQQLGGGGQQQGFGQDAAMYFRERDKPVVPAETFLLTAVPKLIMSSLIIFINVIAIITVIRSNRWTTSSTSSPSSPSSYTNNGFHLKTNKAYILPQSTQGLLHSLFVTYLFLGLLTLYSQISLSTFLLGDVKIIENQGNECLVINSIIIALSLSIALHLVSLGIDRTLAAYLSYQKYTSIARGTIPLWLLSIWLPSMILGILPIVGWKTNFTFCIFLLQFNDDYLRFISSFFITCIILIPILYLFFYSLLKKGQQQRHGGGPRILLYRWHRKLQAHHRLTFILVLIINTCCWAPFHIYLLLACQSCLYSSYGNGFSLEYLFILGLVPSIIIPLIFSLRSIFIDKCVPRIMSKCVTFSSSSHGSNNKTHPNRFNEENYESKRHNPLYKKSNLFFIDDLQLSSGGSSNNSTTTNSQRLHHHHHNKNIIIGDCGTRTTTTTINPTTNEPQPNTGTHHHQIKKKRDRERVDEDLTTTTTPVVPNFFVPHYLPSLSRQDKNRRGKPSRDGGGKSDEIVTESNLKQNSSSINSNKYKSSFRNKFDSYTQNKTLPLRNFLSNFSQHNNNNNNNTNMDKNHDEYNDDDEHGMNTYDSLESDYKYGFPIIPIHGDYKNN